MRPRGITLLYDAAAQALEKTPEGQLQEEGAGDAERTAGTYLDLKHVLAAPEPAELKTPVTVIASSGPSLVRASHAPRPLHASDAADPDRRSGTQPHSGLERSRNLEGLGDGQAYFLDISLCGLNQSSTARIS